MHFGEPGNLAYLRPNYAAVVVKVIKELGGKAFLTDCNTLYAVSYTHLDVYKRQLPTELKALISLFYLPQCRIYYII